MLYNAFFNYTIKMKVLLILIAAILTLTNATNLKRWGSMSHSSMSGTSSGTSSGSSTGTSSGSMSGTPSGSMSAGH
jgi:putative effector of murein hydrolase